MRVPAWTTKSVDITVNGEKVASGTPGQYVEIKRSFKDGDTVAFALPMEFELIKYVGNSQIEGEVRYGIMYGPIFMAVVGPASKDCVQPGGEKIAKLEVTPQELVERLTVKDASKLTFTIDGIKGYTLKPYLSITDSERFDCFPVLARVSATTPTTSIPNDVTESPTPQVTDTPKGNDEFPIIAVIAPIVVILAAAVTIVILIKSKKK